MTAAKPHHVYVVYDGEFCKIGHSADAYKRHYDLSTSNPRDLVLARIFDIPTREMALQVEKISHARLSQVRARGEWFRISPDDAEGAIFLACLEFGDFRFQRFTANRIRLVGVISPSCGNAGFDRQRRDYRVKFYSDHPEAIDIFTPGALG